MPRYFFHVHDGVDLPDRTGKILPDLEAARIEAVVLAGILLVENPVDFWRGDHWSIDVKDETDSILFSLHFTAVEAEARSDGIRLVTQ